MADLGLDKKVITLKRFRVIACEFLVIYIIQYIDEPPIATESLRKGLPDSPQTAHSPHRRAKNNVHCHRALHLYRMLANPALRHRTVARGRPALLGESDHGVEQRHTHGVRHLPHHLSRVDRANRHRNGNHQDSLQKGREGRGWTREHPCSYLLFRRRGWSHLDRSLRTTVSNELTHHHTDPGTTYGSRVHRHPPRRFAQKRLGPRLRNFPLYLGQYRRGHLLVRLQSCDNVI